MINRLHGGKALVTGIDSFVGDAIAKELHNAGMVVAGAYFDPKKLSESTKRMSGFTDVLLNVDQTDEDSVADIVHDAQHALGGLDVLVTVASRQSPESFLQMSPAEIREQVEVNLLGTILLVREAANAMIALSQKEETKRHRAIGVMGSIRGRYSLKMDAYETSKAGLHHMVAGLSPELGEHGISINAVAPGTIDCPIEWQRYGSEENYRRVWGEATPLKRTDGSLATPEDVAETMYFLLNSARITGETVVVDGGYNRKHALPIDQRTS